LATYANAFRQRDFRRQRESELDVGTVVKLRIHVEIDALGTYILGFGVDFCRFAFRILHGNGKLEREPSVSALFFLHDGSWHTFLKGVRKAWLSMAGKSSCPEFRALLLPGNGEAYGKTSQTAARPGAALEPYVPSRLCFGTAWTHTP